MDVNESGRALTVLVDPNKPERSVIYDPSNCIWIPEDEHFKI